MLLYFIFIRLLRIILNQSFCKEGINHCSKCNPITKLCVKCEKEVYIPDKKGGCQKSQKCLVGLNHCFECYEDGKLCKQCDIGYFPDENGGCSNTNYCEIADGIECIKCKKNYILIGKENYYYLINGFKFCKSLNSHDFKNCKIINTENGSCKECEEGYYLGIKDNRCTNVENCSESSFGICKNCNYGFFLDKKHQKCLIQRDIFINCRISNEGTFCDECDKNFFLDEDKKCVFSNYCAKGDFNKCDKCIDGYFLSKTDKICTKEKHCNSGMRDLGICTECIENYYIDFNDGKCKSNLENNLFKNCIKADNGICIYCGDNTYLDENNKCAFSQNCNKSLDGLCIECKDNFYLGLDNKCTDVKNCIYSDFYHCVECIDNYYYFGQKNICEIAKGNLTNCKNSYDGIICDECKNNFYLNKTDNLCYSNKEYNSFYKCAITEQNSENCIKCINNYFLGKIDHKCTTMKGCSLSENDKKCLECDEYYCLDKKKNQCIYNDEINDEDKKYYYRCNKTNEDGTSCEICNNGYELKNGLCVDEFHCEERNEDGMCKRCGDKDEEYIYYHIQCLNSFFGCVESYFNKNCLECNEILNFQSCTKCLEGYIFNEKNECVKKE